MVTAHSLQDYRAGEGFFAGGPKRNLKDVEADWNESAASSGAANAPPFPETVQYPKSCGELCRSTTPAHQLIMADRLRALWARLVAQTAAPRKPALISASHCFLAIHSGDTFRFFRIGCAHSAHGRWEPSQVFAEHHVVCGDPKIALRGIRLRMARSDFAPPRIDRPSPICTSSSGAFLHYTEGQLAAARTLAHIKIK